MLESEEKPSSLNRDNSKLMTFKFLFTAWKGQTWSMSLKYPLENRKNVSINIGTGALCGICMCYIIGCITLQYNYVLHNWMQKALLWKVRVLIPLSSAGTKTWLALKRLEAQNTTQKIVTSNT